jgi:hypothetical protein
MATKLYGVFIGSKFGMCRNRKVAIKAVKKAGDGMVRSMDLPHTRYWDRPTFYACSDPVYVLCANRPEYLLMGMLVQVPGRNEFPPGNFGIVVGIFRGMVEVQPVSFAGNWTNVGEIVTVPAYSISSDGQARVRGQVVH